MIASFNGNGIAWSKKKYILMAMYLTEGNSLEYSKNSKKKKTVRKQPKTQSTDLN